MFYSPLLNKPCWRPIKEMNDLEVFDVGIKSVAQYGNDDMVAHFIYCGYHYNDSEEQIDHLRQIFLPNMRQYGIQSGILTTLDMWRWKLVTEEKVKQAYEGKLKNDEDWEDYEQSIHGDLETFFENLQSQKEIKMNWLKAFSCRNLLKMSWNWLQKKTSRTCVLMGIIISDKILMLTS